MSGNQNWRYEVCDHVGNVTDYSRRKLEAFELAQSRANERGTRSKVYDTYRTAKFSWEFFSLAEGAQGVRIRKL